MTTPTSNMSLLKGVDADNARTYLATNLAASLDIVDVHRHRGGSSGLLVDTLSASQVSGDLFYATGANALSRLAIGTAGQFLAVSGGVPGWSAITAIVRVGGNTTEATTTSGSAVDLLATTGLTIAVDAPVLVVASVRKAAVGSASFGVGLKLNSTTVLEASASVLAPFSANNEVQSGLFVALIGPRVTTYLRAGICFVATGGGVGGVTFDSSGFTTADMPTATLTSISIRALSTGADVMGADEMHVYTLPTT